MVGMPEGHVRPLPMLMGLSPALMREMHAGYYYYPSLLAKVYISIDISGFGCTGTTLSRVPSVVAHSKLWNMGKNNKAKNGSSDGRNSLAYHRRNGPAPAKDRGAVTPSSYTPFVVLRPMYALGLCPGRDRHCHCRALARVKMGRVWTGTMFEGCRSQDVLSRIGISRSELRPRSPKPRGYLDGIDRENEHPCLLTS